MNALSNRNAMRRHCDRGYFESLWIGIACGIALCVGSPSFGQGEEREAFFENRIRPLLIEKCSRCHGDGKSAGGLRLVDRESILRGGEGGAILVPGKPLESRLMSAVRRDGDESPMPPEADKALSPQEVKDLETWIGLGAYWPEHAVALSGRRSWAWQPLQVLPAPTQLPNDSIVNDIDAWIVASQRELGQQRTPEAEKRILLRRIHYDLTGLPPSPEEIESFLTDSRPQAYADRVDRLLHSRAYGEKWGRHWLDVVRYADTAGETADYPAPLAWRYRDYVIDAFQNDKPWDRFLMEQVAGDILGEMEPESRYAESVVATGFLAISRRFGFDSENYLHLTIQDSIDTLGQSMIGLSLGCARCHDHKFDPISMDDYYGLYGILDSTSYPFAGSEQKQKIRSLVPLQPRHIARGEWMQYEQQLAGLRDELMQNQRSLPAASIRSLHEIDGDFEIQAPASGGSRGVLVSPWHYEGNIAVANASQSPFVTRYPRGKVGIAIEGSNPYRIFQAIHANEQERKRDVHLGWDFRLSTSPSEVAGQHAMVWSDRKHEAFLRWIVDANRMWIEANGNTIDLGPWKPQEWYHVTIESISSKNSLRIELRSPTEVLTTHEVLLPGNMLASLNHVEVTNNKEGDRPKLELDNLSCDWGEGLAKLHGSEESPTKGDSLLERIERTAGMDGAFETQLDGQPPQVPWNAGPNSVVRVQASAQSPFRNLHGEGKLGVFMPNRGEYDGFGCKLAPMQAANLKKLYVAFDWNCDDVSRGGEGSWRYYLGHGPGNSAAIELYRNGTQFWTRSGNDRPKVAEVEVGKWYQVRLELDVATRTYHGELVDGSNQMAFDGKFAEGWDGTIDYTFIDSYGHIGGVRPSILVDNFSLRDEPLPDLKYLRTLSEDEQTQRIQVTHWRKQWEAQSQQVEKHQRLWRQKTEHGPFAMAYAMAEGTPHDAWLQKRGEPDQLGERVRRGMIASLGGEKLPETATGSGRLELAKWLVRPDHPLTARVIVNRVWQHHFGRGLVKTPNDFGLRGEPPTHPQLLDTLADDLIRNGWSLHHLHRKILLSATYRQQASRLPQTIEERDHYVGFTRRRLTAEEIRDAILLVTGRLESSSSHDHPFPSPIDWGFTQHGPFSAQYDHRQRSVYLMVSRLKRHPFLALFDGADPNATTPTRLTTTVPTQALFFMNHPLLHESAAAWFDRLKNQSPSDSDRLRTAFLQAFAREPSHDESAFCLASLQQLQLQATRANEGDPVRAAWLALLRSLLASNEFCHVD
ncbi:MAG: PSD1 and planctomycete cytochrome C domain-containing protein [Pirellulales bacterium]